MTKKDTNVGKETKIKVVKNKVAPPLRKPSLKSCTEKGFLRLVNFLKIASDLDIIKKQELGTLNKDEKIGQGSENAKKYLDR